MPTVHQFSLTRDQALAIHARTARTPARTNQLFLGSLTAWFLLALVLLFTGSLHATLTMLPFLAIGVGAVLWGRRPVAFARTALDQEDQKGGGLRSIHAVELTPQGPSLRVPHAWICVAWEHLAPVEQGGLLWLHRPDGSPFFACPADHPLAALLQAHPSAPLPLPEVEAAPIPRTLDKVRFPPATVSWPALVGAVVLVGGAVALQATSAGPSLHALGLALLGLFIAFLGATQSIFNAGAWLWYRLRGLTPIPAHHLECAEDGLLVRRAGEQMRVDWAHVDTMADSDTPITVEQGSAWTPQTGRLLLMRESWDHLKSERPPAPVEPWPEMEDGPRWAHRDSNPYRSPAED